MSIAQTRILEWKVIVISIDKNLIFSGKNHEYDELRK